MLNLFKKLALRSITGGRKEFYSMLINKPVFPLTLVKGKTEFDIITTHDKYILDGFIINYFIVDDIPRTTSVNIFGGIHPNTNTDTRLFCLPKYMIHAELTPQYVIDLRKILSIWNLNNCHFIPNEADYAVRRKK